MGIEKFLRRILRPILEIQVRKIAPDPSIWCSNVNLRSSLSKFGEFSLSANYRCRRIFAFGEFSLSANFRFRRIFAVVESSLLANFSLGEFAFASPNLKGVRFAFASLFGRGYSSLSLRVRFGFLNEIYMPACGIFFDKAKTTLTQ